MSSDWLIEAGTVAGRFEKGLNVELSRRDFLSLFATTSAAITIGLARPVLAQEQTKMEPIMTNTPTLIVDKETKEIKEAQENLVKIFGIQTRLENAGKLGDPQNNADRLSLLWAGGLNYKNTVLPCSSWARNRQIVTIARDMFGKRPDMAREIFEWLGKHDTGADLSVIRYLEFGIHRDKPKRRPENVTFLVSEDIPKADTKAQQLYANDLRTARRYTAGLEFFGLTIVLCSKEYNTGNYPLENMGGNLAVYDSGSKIIYVDRRGLDKIPHEIFHWIEDVGHKFMTPEDYVGFLKFKLKYLLDPKVGRSHPNFLHDLAGWRLPREAKNKEEEFKRTVNGYPLQIWARGAPLHRQVADFLPGDDLKINWLGTSFDKVENFLDFIVKLGRQLGNLMKNNAGRPTGSILDELARINYTFPLDWSEEVGRLLKEGANFNSLVDNYKFVFDRFAQRTFASMLWLGREKEFEPFLGAERIAEAKIRVAELMQGCDKELLAEVFKYIHNKRSDWAPESAQRMYDHLMSVFHN